MAWFRVILVFEQGAKGWTEEYYRQADDLSAAANFGGVPLNWAVQPRHVQTLHRATRVNSLTGDRAGVVVPVNQNGSRQGTATDPGPDVPSVSAVWTLNASAIGGRRKIWLRGLADADTVRDGNTGQDNPSPTLVTNVNRMFTFVSQQFLSLGIRKRKGRNAVGFEPRPLASAQTLAPPAVGTRLTLVNPGANYQQGDLIQVYRTSKKLLPGLAGIWQVINRVDALTYDVSYVMPTSDVIGTPGALVRAVDYDFGLIDSTGFFALRSRATGRPTTLTRGRRRGVSLRH